MRVLITVGSILALAVFATTHDATAGQQGLQRAKDLYAQAAYEEALEALSRLGAGEPAAEAGRYRAACLLALGDPDGAQRVVDEVVDSHPEYLPDPADTSPRVMQIFESTRRVKLPQILKRMYADAKAAMARDELREAEQGFEAVARLASDEDLAGNENAMELKALAEEFLELARLRAVVPPAPVEPEPRRPGVPEPVAPPVITPAVALEQELPGWTPPGGVGGRWEFSGAVRVEIGADGRVVSATIEKSVHPSYDRQLLEAARQWRFEPARRDGAPIASEGVVRVVLKPR
jgi:TonB family protein